MTEDVDPEDAFGALGDPTRVDVLRELAAHRRENPGDPVVGFADLRRRVGVEDSGRFRYHLEELRGRFVEKTGEGYRLAPAGVRIAAAIAAGTYTGRGRLGPTELDGDCPACGTAPVGTFEDGQLEVTCENDHALLGWTLPPNAAAEATVAELAEVATVRVRHQVEVALRGRCPECYGSIDVDVERRGGDRPGFEVLCGHCGVRVVGPLWFCLIAHPRVVAFFERHGRSVRRVRLWEFDFQLREDPFPGGAEAPYHYAVSLGGERFHAAVDDSPAVVRTAVRSAE